MPAPWITDAQLLAALAAVYGKADPAALAVEPGALADANAFAGNEVVGRLLQRGFTLAQIDAWDRRVEFNTTVALWWLFTFGGVPYVGNDQRVKDFDRRKELSDPLTALFIGNVLVNPNAAGEADPGGGVSHGAMGGGFVPLTW